MTSVLLLSTVDENEILAKIARILARIQKIMARIIAIIFAIIAIFFEIIAIIYFQENSSATPDFIHRTSFVPTA